MQPPEIIGIYTISGSLFYTLSNFSTKTFTISRYNLFSNPVIATGFFTTPYVREHQRPAYLIVTHKPLGDDSSIVITADKDNADAYATAIKTINANGIVRTVIELKDLIGECDTLSFKAALADSSNDNNVEDIELTYLYTPLGIENAK